MNSEILIVEWFDFTVISAFPIYLVFLENNVKKPEFELICYCSENCDGDPIDCSPAGSTGRRIFQAPGGEEGKGGM